MRSFVVVVVALLGFVSSVLSASGTCPAGVVPAAATFTANVSFDTTTGLFTATNSAACMTLCMTACTMIPNEIRTAGKTCLNITFATPIDQDLDFSDLNVSICVNVIDATLRKISTGSGNDCVMLAANSGARDISTGEGNDMVAVNARASADDIDLGDGNDAIGVNQGFIDSIRGGDGNDNIRVLNNGQIGLVDGGDGNDFLDLRDVLGSGGTGAPQNFFLVNAGNGNDRVDISNSTALSLNLGDGVDSLQFQNVTIKELDTGSDRDSIVSVPLTGGVNSVTLANDDDDDEDDDDDNDDDDDDDDGDDDDDDNDNDDDDDDDDADDFSCTTAPSTTLVF